MMPKILLLMAITIFAEAVNSFGTNTTNLCSSSCGDIRQISSPFRLTTDPPSCGDKRYSLSCENNITVLRAPLGGLYDFGSSKSYRSYYVQAINYNNYTIRLVDPNIRKHNCSSVPSQGLSTEDVNLHEINGPHYETTTQRGLKSNYNDIKFKEERRISRNVIFFNCERPVLNQSYIDAAPCVFGDNSTATRTSHTRYYSYYYVFDGVFGFKDIEASCRVVQIYLISKIGDDKDGNSDLKSSEDIRNALAFGFELSWLRSIDQSKYCYIDDEDSGKGRCVSICTSDHITDPCVRLSHAKTYKFIVGFILASREAIGVFLIVFLIQKWRKRRLSAYDGIEKFLERHNDLKLLRYSYQDIKMMSYGFHEKLGQGGFGSVYKGTLRSGRLVAIKMLGKSKASGQDFINEVATIGTIHHVNVVQLIGFTAEGSKRALIYEFMPNGSLDKYIFSQKGKGKSLSAMQIFEISLGIARGIDYLHQGCDMRILHFDIKPHNILLDKNFVPKVSDFGLARLYPTDNSMVSLTAARGTIGYIAPELFYKNIGGVSQKADVYSFGMLLMEMANRRKNLIAEAEKSSQIYFPIWVHSQLSQGHDMEIENATEEESKAIKKMVIVALWCIQLKPCDRPSMNKVIDMLEGDVESLEMPPKLYLYPQEENNAEKGHEPEDSTMQSTTFSSASPNEESQEISWISNSC